MIDKQSQSLALTNDLVRLAATKPIRRMTFEEWLKGQKFVNTETKQSSPFIMLSVSQRLRIKEQYEKSEDERIIVETKKQEEAERIRKEEYKKTQYPQHTEYKWTDARLKSEAKKWAQEPKKDLGEDYEGSVHDLAESFLYAYPGVKNFLSSKGIDSMFYNEYIADLLA